MILTNLSNSDGVSTFVMNVCRKLNNSAFCIDVLSHGEPNVELKKEIEHYGGNVYVFPYLKASNIRRVSRMFNNLLSTNNYSIVHCNLPNAAFLYLKLSKSHSVPLRIIHSHATQFAEHQIHKIRNRFLWLLGRKYANRRIACSQAAGAFLFGSKPFETLYNGISYQKFAYNAIERDRIREHLHIEDDEILLGEVGRICPQKNQAFTIKILEFLPVNYKLMLLGSSNPSYKKKLTIPEPLKNRIVFLPPQDNISHFYSAMDLFLLPSYFEGLPFSIIEAQASGLFCLASNHVTREVDCGKTYFLPLNHEAWANQIFRLSKVIAKREPAYSEKFDANFMASNLVDIYTKE